MKKTVLFVSAALLLLSLGAMAGDTSVLRPPKGYKVAIVEFADLECPDCARANPLLEEASKAYKIPIVRYDFPLPKHNWSFDAHVFARWFDSKSKETGDQYRAYIFANQPLITRDNLREWSDKFAAQHKLALPLFVDPQGTLAAKVRADYAVGQKVGIQHTPTIYVVTDSTRSTPFVEVVDRTNLYQILDAAKAEVGGTVTTASAPAPKMKSKTKSQ
jgi:protein-disulfide isomerase